MYESFFGLQDSPFSIAPDPRYLYMSERHREALAHLLYGLEREGGFILLTGEVGTGKTTICRRFIQSVPKDTVLAFILYPKLTARELLGTICDEFGISYPPQSSTKTLIDYINRYLLESHAAGKHTALIIDEAQNLSSDVLEQLRLLTNLETDKKKLLQIILLGQPELKALLARPELRQLSQRITARYHLGELSFEDLGAYISFRLSKAGCPRPLFSKRALKQVYKGSRGIPRLVNLICDRALLGAYSEHASEVTAVMVRTAIKEIGHEIRSPQSRWWDHWAAKGVFSGTMAALVTISIAYWLSPDREFSVTNSLKSGTAMESESPSAGIRQSVESQNELYLTGEPSPAALNSDSDARNLVPPAVTEASEVGLAVNSMASVEQLTAAGPANVLMAASPSSGAMLHASTLGNPLDQAQMQQNLIAYAHAGGDTAQAYQSLLAAWKVDLSDSLRTERDFCRWVEARGLKCLQQEGNWRSLIQLNRPVVLKLMTPDGIRFALPLLLVDDDRIATVQMNGLSYQIPLAELDEYWRGDYSLIWRLPPYESPVIQPGAIQDKDAWLTQQLDLLDSVLDGMTQTEMTESADSGFNVDSDQAGFGSSVTPPLKDRIKAFQQKVGILPDGIAGTITLIMLNSWTDPEVPLLKTSKKS